MKFGGLKYFLLSFVILFFVISCGHKVDRSKLDADAYFAYAKKLFDKGKYYDAYTEFGIITLKFSGSPVVDDAQFYLAESYYGNEEYLLAMAEFQKLVDDYPQSPYAEKAYYKIGLSAKQLSQRAELDQKYTHMAIRHLQNFIEAYPKSDLRADADKNLHELRLKLSKKMFQGANVYYKMGYYDSAIIYLDILMEKYYDTKYASRSMYLKSRCLEKMKKYEEAMSNYNAFIEKYPENEKVKEAKKHVGEIQEKLTQND